MQRTRRKWTPASSRTGQKGTKHGERTMTADEVLEQADATPREREAVEVLADRLAEGEKLNVAEEMEGMVGEVERGRVGHLMRAVLKRSTEKAMASSR